MLTPVGVCPGPLDVAAPGQCHHHRFIRDEVFVPHLRIEARHNFGPAVITKPLNDLAQFFDDDFSLFLGTFQNGREFFDLALQFLGLIQDFLAL